MAVPTSTEDWGKLCNTLLSDATEFWLKHSLDQVNGGYYNCLGRDGTVYDTTKHVWLQGRQTWMLARLYCERGEYRTPQVLHAVILGAEFLLKYGERNEEGDDKDRVYFSVAADGKPVSLQRKIFSECFFVMALSEFARLLKEHPPENYATTHKSIFGRAEILMDRILSWKDQGVPFAKPNFEGAKSYHGLGMPMIILGLINVMQAYAGPGYHQAREKACVDEILLHVHPEMQLVLENVAPVSGDVMFDDSEGRLHLPGHSLEAAWFVLEYAVKRDNKELMDVAAKMTRWSIDAGWDVRHGGLFYFLDCSGGDPMQLEWSQKLWWVHCEAMVAAAMCWWVCHTGKGEGSEMLSKGQEGVWADEFARIATYTVKHFPDQQGSQPSFELVVVSPNFKVEDLPQSRPGGEWFGYLQRDGSVNQWFKGGPYKGFFHVPRALMYCSNLLLNKI